MKNKALLLTFDTQPSTSFDYKEFHNFITTLPLVVTWWHHLSGTYILIVNQETKISQITDAIVDKYTKMHFICEIKLTSHYGFLNEKAWKWISSTIKKYSLE